MWNCIPYPTAPARQRVTKAFFFLLVGNCCHVITPSATAFMVSLAYKCNNKYTKWAWTTLGNRGFSSLCLSLLFKSRSPENFSNFCSSIPTLSKQQSSQDNHPATRPWAQQRQCCHCWEKARERKPLNQFGVQQMHSDSCLPSVLSLLKLIEPFSTKKKKNSLGRAWKTQ